MLSANFEWNLLFKYWPSSHVHVVAAVVESIVTQPASSSSTCTLAKSPHLGLQKVIQWSQVYSYCNILCIILFALFVWVITSYSTLLLGLAPIHKPGLGTYKHFKLLLWFFLSYCDLCFLSKLLKLDLFLRNVCKNRQTFITIKLCYRTRWTLLKLIKIFTK